MRHSPTIADRATQFQETMLAAVVELVVDDPRFAPTAWPFTKDETQTLICGALIDALRLFLYFQPGLIATAAERILRPLDKGGDHHWVTS